MIRLVSCQLGLANDDMELLRLRLLLLQLQLLVIMLPMVTLHFCCSSPEGVVPAAVAVHLVMVIAVVAIGLMTVVVLLLTEGMAVVIAVVGVTTDSVGEGARGRRFAVPFGVEVARARPGPDRGRGGCNDRASVVNRRRNCHCPLSQSRRDARVEDDHRLPFAAGVRAASTVIPARRRSSRRGQVVRRGCCCSCSRSYCYCCCCCVRAASTLIHACRRSSRWGQVVCRGCCCSWCCCCYFFVCSCSRSGRRLLQLQMVSGLEACGQGAGGEGRDGARQTTKTKSKARDVLCVKWMDGVCLDNFFTFEGHVGTRCCGCCCANNQASLIAIEPAANQPQCFAPLGTLVPKSWKKNLHVFRKLTVNYSTAASTTDHGGTRILGVSAAVDIY